MVIVASFYKQRWQLAPYAFCRKASNIWLIILSSVLFTCQTVIASDLEKPIVIGLTAEFGLKNSYSAQAVEFGILVAIDEINASGGVLGGRPLVLKALDDRSVPARAIDNLREFIADPDTVAVFGARYSPVLLELLPVAQEAGMPLLDPWASANGITAHDYKPSYTFRLSLNDNHAMPVMISSLQGRGYDRLGLVLPNTAWGRSNEQAAQQFVESHPEIKILRKRWYNWGDTSFFEIYKDILAAGANALVLVANDVEGARIVDEIASLPPAQRLPIACHWGITGGEFFKATRESLPNVDLTVVQSFSFFKADPAVRDHFMATAEKLRGIKSFETIEAPVGVGQAYDLTKILAAAINKAGGTDRAAIRSALENVGPYHGLAGTFKRPFTPDKHDALGQDSVFMARYRQDGVIVPVP